MFPGGTDGYCRFCMYFEVIFLKEISAGQHFYIILDDLLVEGKDIISDYLVSLL